jgi:hypothetical protein
MNDDDLSPREPDLPPDARLPERELPPLSPVRDSTGTRFAEAAGRGLLGTVSFVLSAFVFGVVSLQNQVLGLALSIIVVFALFAARKRSGPSPLLGAVAVGAAIAMVLVGSCTLIVLSSR